MEETKTNKFCSFSDLFATKKDTGTKTKNSPRTYSDEQFIWSYELKIVVKVVWI
jgi:hypothetical protein